MQSASSPMKNPQLAGHATAGDRFPKEERASEEVAGRTAGSWGQPLQWGCSWENRCRDKRSAEHPATHTIRVAAIKPPARTQATPEGQSYTTPGWWRWQGMRPEALTTPAGFGLGCGPACG